MVVPITDVVKMALSVADISAEPIIGTPLVNIDHMIWLLQSYQFYEYNYKV